MKTSKIKMSIVVLLIVLSITGQEIRSNEVVTITGRHIKKRIKHAEKFSSFFHKNVDELVEILPPTTHRDYTSLKPTNFRKVRLKSRTGYYLEVLNSGKVAGNTIETNYSVLEMQVIAPQIKRIKSVLTGKYISINSDGKVKTKTNISPDIYFIEEVLPHSFYSYFSIKYPKSTKEPPWLLGLKQKVGNKSYGVACRASRTLPGDNETQFSIIDF
ncbi:fibroblast growth factor 3 [Hydra vulgaris]|uniref:fibroblast growth factor 3 n=1 Tax=Hydra vulgaris TaxID=6087 RepID=UPI0002B454DF|nr:fibroblast growth factor 3 [Hydra vulgaris]